MATWRRVKYYIKIRSLYGLTKTENKTRIIEKRIILPSHLHGMFRGNCFFFELFTTLIQYSTNILLYRFNSYLKYPQGR